MNEEWFSDRILERFLEYVRIDTASDGHSRKRPTTPGQWDLLNLIAAELKDLGIDDVSLDKNGFLIAGISSNAGKGIPSVGFMAHVDTSSDVPGSGVKPIVHRNYNGGIIRLKDDLFLDPEKESELGNYAGDTVITSDGTTLLGADNKAGIAEIMTAVEFLVKNPEFEHGDIELIFTPDEETGFGMDLFPYDRLKSKLCYTIDGDLEGTIEAECFNGYSVSISFLGNTIHPGYARGKFTNAVVMMSSFVNMLPGSESPEATDNRFGFYFPIEARADVGKAELSIFLRDFEMEGINRRIEVLKSMAGSIEKIFPGGKVEIQVKKMYSNMRDSLKKNPDVMDLLEKAVREAGVKPRVKIIRGGTDGARLSENGIPAPNVFTGGSNFHSLKEWIPLSAMVKSSFVVLNLIKLWKEKGN